MSSQKSIRDLLIEQLDGRNAHVDFNQAVQGVPWRQAGIKIERAPHTIWELVEHIRITQDDILEFCRNENYEEIDWPDDYWPSSNSAESRSAWRSSTAAVQKGFEEMKEIVLNPTLDLQTPLPHGDGQTLFREAMLFVDHGAYHIGQIVQVRRMLGNW